MPVLLTATFLENEFCLNRTEGRGIHCSLNCTTPECPVLERHPLLYTLVKQICDRNNETSHWLEICMYKIERQQVDSNISHGIKHSQNTLLCTSMNCLQKSIYGVCFTILLSSFPKQSVPISYMNQSHLLNIELPALKTHGLCVYAHNEHKQDSHYCVQYYLIARSEMFFINSLCKYNQFRCEDGSCISQNSILDGSADCFKGSDEIPPFVGFHVCASPFCQCDQGEKFFQCASKGCIHWNKVCDGNIHCTDASDELYCLDNYQMRSESNSFTKNFDMSAGTRSLVSNNQSSEYILCKLGYPDKFHISGLCIYEFDHNGMMRHCSDGAHLLFCAELECSGYYKCPISYCIPVFSVCDSKLDCPNGEDEDGCHGNLTCPGMLKCKGGGCVHQKDVCNGHVDCSPHGDDEYRCEWVDCPEECLCNGPTMSCKTSGHLKISVDKHLLLQVNGSSTVVPYILNAHHLFRFNISWLNIEMLRPRSFYTFMNLRHLDLSNNKITVVTTFSFVGLINLVDLYLAGNPIKVLQSDAFSGLQSLILLNLTDLGIKTIHVNAFRLSRIVTIDLSRNKMTTLSLKMVQDLSDTRNMLLMGNNIKRVEPTKKSLVRTPKIILNTTQQYLYCWEHLFSGHNITIFYTLCNISKPHVDVVISILLLIFAIILYVVVVRFGNKTFISTSNLQITLTNLVIMTGLLMGTYVLLLTFKITLFDRTYEIHKLNGAKHRFCNIIAAMQISTSVSTAVFHFFRTMHFLHVVTRPQGERWNTKRILIFASFLSMLVVLLSVYSVYDFFVLADVGPYCSILLHSPIRPVSMVLISTGVACVTYFGGLLQRNVSEIYLFIYCHLYSAFPIVQCSNMLQRL